METVKTLIIGGGIAGLATAWHVARDSGGSVLLLEKERFLGTHSTGRNAAILRTLGPDPLTTRLGRRSAMMMRRPPEGFSAVPLIDARGLLLVADADHGDDLAGWLAAVEPDPDCREITPEAFHRQAPFYHGKVSRAFSFAEEGRLDIAALVAGFASGARAAGAEIRCGIGVRRLLQAGSRVTGVELDDGVVIQAERTVLAAGGWAGKLGNGAGSKVQLRPTRRHLMVTTANASIDPSWPVVWALGDEFYCRPESGGLLLCACDQVEVEPESCSNDDHVCEVIAEKVSRLLPEFGDVQAARFWCGVRTLTRDDRFAIGPDPDVNGLFWVAGLGGHGMVCSFEIGRLAAARLAGEAPPDDEQQALDPGRLVVEPA